MPKKSVKKTSKKTVKPNVAKQKKPVKRSGKKSQNNTALVVITHILGLFTSFLAPLIIMLAVDDDYVKRHAKVVLNWEFSLLIYTAFSILMIFAVIGIILLPALGIIAVVFPIIGAVKANKGEIWKYPLSIPFFKI